MCDTTSSQPWVAMFQQHARMHHVLVPEIMIQNLSTATGQQRMFVYLEKLFMASLIAPGAWLYPDQQLAQMTFIRLAHILLSHRHHDCDHDMPDADDCVTHWCHLKDRASWFATFILAMDDRKDLWGLPLVLQSEIEEAFLTQAMIWRQAMLAIADQPSKDFVSQQAHHSLEALTTAADDFLDRLTLSHHLHCLQRLISELTYAFESFQHTDQAIVAKFIVAASTTLQWMEEHALDHGQGMFVDQTDRWEAQCAHMNRLWTTPQLQRALEHVGLTRAHMLFARHLE